MKKAPSTILATAGITVGLLGVALPASASVTAHQYTNPTKTGLPIPIPTKTGLPIPIPTKTGLPIPIPTKTGLPIPIPTKTGLPTPTKTGHPGPPTKGGHPGKPKGYHPGKPGTGHPAPKPKEVCHRVYTKAPHLTAQEQKKHPSWQQPKEGYVVKCTTVKPAVKKPVHHGPPPHHKAPAKKHPWWHFW